ncbi:MAG: hypothetical protein HQK96_19225 [Nitrospirae bacterium]|nr:hypothetical protein [Nitrospirota bacterium]
MERILALISNIVGIISFIMLITGGGKYFIGLLVLSIIGLIIYILNIGGKYKHDLVIFFSLITILWGIVIMLMYPFISDNIVISSKPYFCCVNNGESSKANFILCKGKTELERHKLLPLSKRDKVFKITATAGLWSQEPNDRAGIFIDLVNTDIGLSLPGKVYFTKQIPQSNIANYNNSQDMVTQKETIQWNYEEPPKELLISATPGTWALSIDKIEISTERKISLLNWLRNKLSDKAK